MYTLDGYLAAVEMRETNTLMVEGNNDRLFVQRIIAQLELAGCCRSVRLTVDQASAIQGAGGLGSREVIEKVHSDLTAGSRFAGFVDREFRKFLIACPVVRDDEPRHVVVPPTLFWTRGHSTENYLIEPECVIDALVSNWAHLVTGELRAEVLDSFDRVVWQACAVSLGLADAGLLSRSGGLTDFRNWSRVAGQWIFDLERLCNVLKTRHCGESAETVLRNVVAGWLGADPSRRLAEPRRLGHGAFCWEQIWTWLGALAFSRGATPGDAESVASGHQEAKFKASCDSWVRRHVTDVSPERPAEFVAWLRTTA